MTDQSSVQRLIYSCDPESKIFWHGTTYQEAARLGHWRYWESKRRAMLDYQYAQLRAHGYPTENTWITHYGHGPDNFLLLVGTSRQIKIREDSYGV